MESTSEKLGFLQTILLYILLFQLDMSDCQCWIFDEIGLKKYSSSPLFPLNQLDSNIIKGQNKYVCTSYINKVLNKVQNIDRRQKISLGQWVNCSQLFWIAGCVNKKKYKSRWSEPWENFDCRYLRLFETSICFFL